MFAGVAAGQEMLAAFLDPFDRTSRAQRQQAGQRLFLIRWNLDAERAADLRLDDVHRMFVQP